MATDSRQAQATAAAVVTALVGHRLLDPARAEEATIVVRSEVGGTSAVAPPMRRRLAEVAGYVGGALVVAAATVFLVQEWPTLSTAGQVSTLAATALVLFLAAVVVVRTGLRPARGAGGHGVRRRLASTLTCGSAVAAAFAAGVLVADRVGDFSSAPWLAGSVALLVAALAGYLLAPSALGQLIAAAGAAQVVFAGLEVFVPTVGEVTEGACLLAVGVVWLALAERGVWWERLTGLSVGCALVLGGTQYPVLGPDHAWVGYAATMLVAVAAVVLYIRGRSIPYLVTAVAALTLVVPEALLDWTEGSLGPVGLLMATGVTLLAASLLGLRLRHEVGDGPTRSRGAAA